MDHRPDLPSYPTRRSSDLEAQAEAAVHVVERRRRVPQGPEMGQEGVDVRVVVHVAPGKQPVAGAVAIEPILHLEDRKSTRLNSSHSSISYAVFCLKKESAT